MKRIKILNKLLNLVIMFSILSTYAYAQNAQPTANAGIDRNVVAGQETMLFGSGTDNDNDPIRFKWQLIDQPGGASAVLSQDNTPNPIFTPDPDLVGKYIFSLRTNDGKVFSSRLNVIITSKKKEPSNSKPVSYPGPNRNINVNEEAIIAGYGIDADGDNLIYMWHVLRSPAGSKILLQDPNRQSLLFKPDLEGNYVLALIVNDGMEDSSPREVKIKASNRGINRAPSADTGPNRTIKLGEAATLSGTGSDPDNDQLRFTWLVVSKPSESRNILLTENNIPNASFVPDAEGSYTFSLTVDDGQLDSEPNVVTYAAQTPPLGNNKPTANAGIDISVFVGDEVELQGSGADADGNTLSFRWSITNTPANSGSFLSNPNTKNPKFMPDIAGIYTFQLITNDGNEDSNPDYININAAQTPKLCVHGTCDLNTKRWCDNGLMTSDGYCEQCSNFDGSCPICIADVCDGANQRWCDSGVWSVIGYCNKCADVDSLCGTSCESNACDTKNKKWCNNLVWEETNYCTHCSDLDSSCSAECINNACDVKNKKWCDKSIWKETNYCTHCGEKDFSCGLSCQNNVCDTDANKWCNVIFWTTIDYCKNCQDSECLGRCANNACDITAKKWCDNGAWSSVNYCGKCGNKDSSCSVSCQENVCDTAANKRCFDGIWIPIGYCDYCSLRDSDCTIVCAEGECDAINKKICKNSKWVEESYGSLCRVQEAKTIKNICIEYGNCTTGNDCTNNLECSSGFCSNNKCSEPMACNDSIKNGNETDVDCGGNKCEKCKNGKECNINSDCLLNFCDLGICKAIDTCNNGILNSNEADIDCGGICLNKCQTGKACGVDEDCEIDLFCDAKICLEKEPIEEAALDEEKIVEENDKEEIGIGTYPLDPKSKPKGISGVIFLITILIIVLGFLGYGIHYYLYLSKSKVYKTKGEEARFAPVYERAPILRKTLEKSEEKETFKKREEEKRKRREELFGAFGKKGSGSK